MKNLILGALVSLMPLVSIQTLAAEADAKASASLDVAILPISGVSVKVEEGVLGIKVTEQQGQSATTRYVVQITGPSAQTVVNEVNKGYDTAKNKVKLEIDTTKNMIVLTGKTAEDLVKKNSLIVSEKTGQLVKLADKTKDDLEKRARLVYSNTTSLAYNSMNEAVKSLSQMRDISKAEVFSRIRDGKKYIILTERNLTDLYNKADEQAQKTVSLALSTAQEIQNEVNTISDDIQNRVSTAKNKAQSVAADAQKNAEDFYATVISIRDEGIYEYNHASDLVLQYATELQKGSMQLIAKGQAFATLAEEKLTHAKKSGKQTLSEALSWARNALAEATKVGNRALDHADELINHDEKK